MHRDTHFIQTLQSKVRVISGSFQPNGKNDPILLKKNGIKSIVRYIPGIYVLTFEDFYSELICGQVSLQLNTPGPYETGFRGVGLFPPNQLAIGVLDPTLTSAKEETQVTCPADTGTFASEQVTVSGGATLGNGDFFTLYFPSGDVYAFYYIIDGVIPTNSGAAWNSVPFSNQIPITISSIMTAPVVANFTKAIIDSFLPGDVTTSVALATITITQTTMGDTLPSVGYDGASNLTANITAVHTAGANSNLNNTYWLLNSADDINKYYVWYNVNNEGINPNPPGLIPLEVTINTGDNSTNVATATAAAVFAAFGDFNPVTSALNVVDITNTAFGPTTDASAGTTTGFVFNVITQGSITNVDLPINPNNIISYSFYFNDTDAGW